MPTSTPGEIPPLSSSSRIGPSTSPASRSAPAAAADELSAPLALAPGARVLWRAARVTQWELAGRAVIVDGADSRDIARLLAPEPGEASQAAREEVRRVRSELHRAGYLWRPSGGIGASARPPSRGAGRAVATPERLLADLQALAPRFGDDAGHVMSARRTRAVRVTGTDRAAAAIAVLLAAAGVGRIELPATGPVRLEHTMPGGLSAVDEGRRWSEAAADAIRRAAPEADVGPSATDDAPDLVVVVSPRPMADDVRDQLHDDAQPYLCVGVDGAHAVVGPLVRPGWTSCVRCLELHRRDRDPAWWALAAQLSTAPRRSTPSDVALCAMVAGFATSQSLSLLDGEEPTTLDATVEWTLPDWRMRRRTRATHPDCGCSALLSPRIRGRAE